ncbi:putative meiotically up-regulated gene 118 protein [Rosellinia necatrix]|uniref:Putative meiotically up-regulated gene 118 protein n=1 Tax=Rosellinia necatrix TaxID=77044 RepID=A0A1W2TPY9_ROSNE|nr:putative meiotically up-regulated gene 118 protein [Rosellinia necatrix]
MAPVQPRKRKSESSSPSASTQRSPIKKRKLGITLAQKQALIDNLQLEISERARRLRAQYNIQAQQLRSRVEMRVNRIPTTLRRLKMSELLTRSLQPQRPRPAPRSHNAISGADKENQGEAIDNPKKRLRGVAVPAPITASQVLSPTSSNTRVLPRDRPTSPTKSIMSRPASPIKPPPAKASSNLLSSIVERAKASRPAAATRKPTASSTASSNAATTATGRTRKAPAPPPNTATARGKRKASVASESSEGSATSVVKKASTASKTTKTAPASKKAAIGTTKAATTKKAPAVKAPTTGRTLRKRA